MNRALSIAVVVLLAHASVPARSQRLEGIGLHGYVLGPDGLPVSAGSVVLLQSNVTRATASIGPDGRFRIEATTSRPHQLLVSAPDLTPYRVTVSVPPSRTLRLPVIRLAAPTYFRVRLVTAAGEPISSQWLRRQSLDASGDAVPEPPDARAVDAIDADGTITIGPLPRGLTMMYVDAPGLARTRLPDVHVNGDEPLLEGGTVVVEAGTILQLDVVDGTGAPVPKHEVSLEDVRPLSPIAIPSARADAQGRVTFDRLAAGQYRVRAQVIGRCGPNDLWVAPIVPISGTGAAQRRLVVGGTARFRLRSPHGDWPNIAMSASPEGGARPLSPALMALKNAPQMKRVEPGCGAFTDAEGRVVLENFPPGPAVVSVRVPNATHIRRVNVPEGGREIVLQVPEGLLSVRVTSADMKRPVPVAAVTWTGGGARVESLTTATGDALLDSVGTTGGTLAVAASGYESAELAFEELPATVVEVVLEPSRPTNLQARVVTTAGAPLPDAVVELSAQGAADAGHIAVTDKAGLVRFIDAPGSRRLTAAANGFATRTLQVPERDRTDIVLPLAQGYRAAVAVDLPSSWGRQAIRVLNGSGASVDPLLDIVSDRMVDPPGALSLGALMPGNYTIEFQGARGRHQIAITIVDRDVAAAVRGAEGANASAARAHAP